VKRELCDHDHVTMGVSAPAMGHLTCQNQRSAQVFLSLSCFGVRLKRTSRQYPRRRPPTCGISTRPLSPHRGLSCPTPGADAAPSELVRMRAHPFIHKVIAALLYEGLGRGGRRATSTATSASTGTVLGPTSFQRANIL
jgi:hypothetical protein